MNVGRTFDGRHLVLATTLSLTGCVPSSMAPKGPLLVPFAPQGATDEVARPRRYALLVGINEFEDPRFSPLRFARADATELGAALSGFDQVVALTRPEQTTRAAFLEALRTLQSEARNPRDTVLVYVSTHGTLGQRPGAKRERYLVMADTRLDLVSETGIPVADLIRQAETFRSRRVLLVLAACHSGKGKSQHSDALTQALAGEKAPMVAPLADVSEATIVLTAAAFGETAKEDDRLGHDVYTYFFLEGLKRADRDGDGAVTASEAHDYAREQTYGYTQGVQRPTSESEILGKDPIVLRGTPHAAGKPVVYSYATSAEGTSVMSNGTPKGTLPGGIALEPGPQELALRNGRTGALLFKRHVNLAPGDRLELSQLIPRPIRGRLQAGAGLWSPLTAPARQGYLTETLAGELRVGLENWLWSGSYWGLGYSVLAGAGRAPGVGEQIPFALRGHHVELAVGHELLLGQTMGLQLGASLGHLWVGRTLSTDTYRAEESTKGATAGVQGRFTWLGASPWRLGCEAELKGSFLALGPSEGPHLLARLGLFAGWAF